ncbi:hypothetical protein EN871_17490 [bacterium M00.F.Ca.ET.228.01.1.1]|uniref:hypothetical protein n=1 Tax=Paraburkholderia phenoliruptrix TaxID=252970 RepID=UPI0010926884|nr:hypothetical protein [Paraburkholderia phenoliruptrix]TGP42732.1 hypothetical protein EN871_17490 [bacterium M00.F.Ca.ET.228.01.1.1]TGR98922.1 hypothetical protein EN834_20130 [bacterium M00.F.Ca.ET.191.01.1.1]TGU03236.1 hypothetical protein EN798_20950 [bacterium M00.F.Ca.ET.155.01.1.1]MBW0447357.1 hypothetical protein [Paraburkholderia phenoliruptrix]MBW9098963.1 hypothetical protein [Paraburkholderia phenoliruptrix]
MNNILRLILLYLMAFFLAFLGFVAVKLCVMMYVAIFYGGGFGWDARDTKFVVVNGSLLGLVFSVYATVAWVRNR